MAPGRVQPWLTICDREDLGTNVTQTSRAAKFHQHEHALLFPQTSCLMLSYTTGSVGGGGGQCPSHLPLNGHHSHEGVFPRDSTGHSRPLQW